MTSAIPIDAYLDFEIYDNNYISNNNENSNNYDSNIIDNNMLNYVSNDSENQ